MVLFRRATSAEGIAAKLAGIAEHATDAGVLVLLGLVQCFSAVVLAVTLYGITREQDNDLAMLGLVCRVGAARGRSSAAARGNLHGPIAQLMWLPMLAFEVPLAPWLITRGVAAPARTQGA